MTVFMQFCIHVLIVYDAVHCSSASKCVAETDIENSMQELMRLFAVFLVIEHLQNTQRYS